MSHVYTYGACHRFIYVSTGTLIYDPKNSLKLEANMGASIHLPCPLLMPALLGVLRYPIWFRASGHQWLPADPNHARLEGLRPGDFGAYYCFWLQTGRDSTRAQVASRLGVNQVMLLPRFDSSF
ncbi:unnamed protein product, partial [Protopolystoma xenopodis]